MDTISAVVSKLQKSELTLPVNPLQGQLNKKNLFHLFSYITWS